MDVVFDTSTCAEGESFEAYRGALEQALVPVGVECNQLERQSFRARICGADLGALNVVHSHGHAITTMQSAGQACRNPYALALLMPLRDCVMEFRLGQGSARQLVVTPGDMLITGCRQPGSMVLHNTTDVLTVHIPPDQLSKHFESDLEYSCSLLKRGQGGAVRMLAGFVESMPVSLDGMNPSERAPMGEYFLGLLTLALRARGVPQEAPLESLGMADVYFRSALSILRRYLDEPGLSPAFLAHQLSISERHLFRVFAEQGTSFRRELRRLRLGRAAEALADPSISHLRLTDIALLAGFRSVSHFSRVFRAELGVSPSQYRESRLQP